MSREYFYVGTYTQPILFGTGNIFRGKGKGIYYLSLDTQTGQLCLEGEPEETDNPSYLCLSLDGTYLYAVNELKEYEGGKGGVVSAFLVNKADGELTRLNIRPTGGMDPCHVIVNDGQTHVFVSNFMSGSVSVFPIEKDGTLGERTQLIQHKGNSVTEERQEGPHAHSLIFDRDQSHAFVPDLGLDRLMVYETDFADRTPLKPAKTPFLQVGWGQGPRFCEFHPGGRFCYLINEISSSISLLYYEETEGTFRLHQTVSTLPAGCTVPNTCADLHITPDGKYLYGSNRGHDSLAVFEVNQMTGELLLKEVIPSGGRTPRNFVIDAEGKYLLAANQDTDNIAVFQIDRDSGKLEKRSELCLPSPVCIRQAVKNGQN